MRGSRHRVRCRAGYARIRRGRSGFLLRNPCSTESRKRETPVSTKSETREPRWPDQVSASGVAHARAPVGGGGRCCASGARGGGPRRGTRRGPGPRGEVRAPVRALVPRLSLGGVVGRARGSPSFVFYFYFGMGRLSKVPSSQTTNPQSYRGEPRSTSLRSCQLMVTDRGDPKGLGVLLSGRSAHVGCPWASMNITKRP